MSQLADQVLQTFAPDARGGLRAACVSVVGEQGSVPRGVGAWIWVSTTETYNTIGGGNLEWLAMARARACLRGDSAWGDMDIPLGPSTGQCCGGRVSLRVQPLTRDLLQHQWSSLVESRWPVLLIGAGHVGAAIVQQLLILPARVFWRDSRDDAFSSIERAAPLSWAVAGTDADSSQQIDVEVCQPVSASVNDAPPGSAVLIMSHSHQEDFDVVVACLQRQAQRGDLRFVGLIGSDTKWASFQSRLRARGFTDEALAGVTCPIGLPSVGGKEPQLIALAVAAQLASIFVSKS